MSAVEEPKEAKMRTYTISELFRLTRAELMALQSQILAELAALPSNAPEREIALANLNAIRCALSRRRPEPKALR